MISKRPEKDTENPPGQIRYDVPPLDKSIEEWKRWEKERNFSCPDFGRCNCLKGSCEKGFKT